MIDSVPLLRSVLRAACVAALGLGTVTAPLQANDAQDPGDPALEARITKLIEQLGDNRYTIRERAQAELNKLGFAAFEALDDAQDHADIEIALRAQYLVRSMRIDWARDDDPPAVKTILRGYEKLGVELRRKRMTALAQLESGQGTGALCRLARFEHTQLLSKQAALLVMGQPESREAAIRSGRQQTILRAIGRSKRAAAEWLKIYARSLVDPQPDVAAWDRTVKAEQQLLDEFPEQSDRKILQDLLRRQVDMLKGLGRDDEAVDVIRRLFSQIDGNSEELLETVDWLAEQQAWAMIEELARQFSDRYQKDALLLYRLAQAHSEQGRDEVADQLAKRALEIDRAKADKHLLAAFLLQRRGLFRWAEQEYRYAITLGPAASPQFLNAHYLLSEMLHDIADDLAAAKVMENVVKTLGKDPSDPRIRPRRNRREPAAITARMHYFYARHSASVSNREQQIEHLEKAVESDPRDADVLIAMYRMRDQGESWKERTKELIAAAVETLRQQIKDAPDHPTPYNQLAWLIANTEGDFNEALRCSQKSLELAPHAAGYLDTLAHCYYAQGDLKNAVKTQARAVREDPYSGQINRAYELFKKKLSESPLQAKDPDG